MKNKTINPKFYSKLEIKSIDNIEKVNDNNESNVIFAPYIPMNVDKPSNEYNEFMEEYERKHKCCPKCGSIHCYTTLVGYILYIDKKEEYKDLNNCTCPDCHNRHTMHERISIDEALELPSIEKSIDELKHKVENHKSIKK